MKKLSYVFILIPNNKKESKNKFYPPRKWNIWIQALPTPSNG